MSEEREKDDRPSWEGELYRRQVVRLENLPQNRSGADKTWVHRAEADFREHFRKAQVPEKLDEVYAGEDSDLDPALALMQSIALPPEKW